LESDLSFISEKETTADSLELQLLLCCIRAQIASVDCLEALKTLLQEEIDWPRVLQIAAEHKVAPLVYQSLQKNCPDAVPQAVLQKLQEASAANALRNLYLTLELLKLLKAFAAQGITVIPFKGPVLATLVYGHLSLRQFGDLDILVQDVDIDRAKDLLIAHGYQPRKMLTANQEEDYLQYSFVRSDRTNSNSTVRQVFVDLHKALTPRYFPSVIDSEFLGDRLQQQFFGGGKIFTLSPEDLLLYLCVHGCKDAWERLAWICDIAALQQAYPELMWMQVLEQAKQLGYERMVLLGLSLTHTVLEVALPNAVLQRIQSCPGLEVLTEQVRQQLFFRAGMVPEAINSTVWSFRFRLHWSLMETFKDKLRLSFFILRFIVTPSYQDVAALPLPTTLAFVHYLIRPIRLISKFGVRPLSQLPNSRL
jgi:hypothetical protein